MAQTGETISHPGVIKSIEGNNIKVMILSTSACSSCQVKGACNMAEMAEKLVDIEQRNKHMHQVGDTVTVTMKLSHGRMAVILGYFVPFVVMLVTLISLNLAGLSEGLTGLFSLLILVPYYTILYFNRDRLNKNFSFQIS
ncbi:MAG: SoxR reducing system RseC family protein [Bacteroidales bacterium]|nr:SoxR reducing system RseC family protein [Bacteroidales bacterium]